MTKPRTDPLTFTRRALLGGALGVLGTAIGGTALAAQFSPGGNPFRDRFQSYRQTFRVEPDRDEAERIVRNILAGRAPRTDMVTLIAPDIAENGNAVPVTIRVDCAMAGDDYPKTVHLLALENPFPEIAKYAFTPAQGVAEVSVRCRMRATAPLVVVADMADGTVGYAEKLVNVTLGACS